MSAVPHYVHMQHLTETGFAFVDPTCQLGRGVKVWHFAVVLAGCRLGDGVMIGSRTELGFRCIVGKDSRIGSGVYLPSDTVIGERVFIGPNVTCTDDRTPKVPGPNDPPYTAQPPIIEHDAAIGAGAVLLPGVRIGHHARIGAGAIVTRDVPPHGHVRSEPARARALSPASAGWATHDVSPFAESSPTPRTTGSL